VGADQAGQDQYLPFNPSDVLVHRTVPGPISQGFLERQERRESNARSYPRRIPIAVDWAAGPYVVDADGRAYLDFLTGAGSLPLGHSHPELVRAATAQLGRFTQGLDLPTAAKDAFTDAQLSMLPRQMRDYKIHFCGPTGANAIDAAVKLAKTATGRSEVVAFSGGFHGTTHLAMSLTGLVSQRAPVGNTMPGVHFAPFSYCVRCPVGLEPNSCAINCASYTETMLTDAHGGALPPAAIILELVQGEGGVIPARREFARRIAAAARASGALLIVDEVQTGCGRTGTWFAFERYGIEPDILCASKALSGIGIPIAIIMYRRDLDVWAPGAHTGTFRGHQPAFAAGAEFVRIMRRDGVLANVRERGGQISEIFSVLESEPAVRETRGCGLMWGIELQNPGTGEPAGGLARAVQRQALEHGLILEVGGRHDAVVRLLPPLNITPDVTKHAGTLLADLIREQAQTYPFEATASALSQLPPDARPWAAMYLATSHPAD